MTFKAPPLETNDDGLLMRCSGAWAYHKLHYVNEYMCRFIVSMRKKNWRAINYIDLFAGPGKNKLPNGMVIMGSPLLALSQMHSFDRYYFADQHSSQIDALKQRCGRLPRAEKAVFYNDDANLVVDRVVQEIERVDGVYRHGVGQSLNLAFLDPEGLELHWDSVAKLASLRTDMIIYYPQQGITRNAKKQIGVQPLTAIDIFFGDTTWREIYQQHQGGEEPFLHRALLDHYKQKLATFEYQVEDPLPEPLFKNRNDAPLYRLLFVSKHPLGNRFWSDVTKNLPNGQMRLI